MSETITLREFLEIRRKHDREISELKLQHERAMREAHQEAIKEAFDARMKIQAAAVSAIISLIGLAAAAIHYFAR